MEDRKVEWIGRVWPDWTTLQLVDSGMAFAFNRASGRVYKLPHSDVPIVQYDPIVPAETGDSWANSIPVLDDEEFHYDGEKWQKL